MDVRSLVIHFLCIFAAICLWTGRVEAQDPNQEILAAGLKAHGGDAVGNVTTITAVGTIQYRYWSEPIRISAILGAARRNDYGDPRRWTLVRTATNAGFPNSGFDELEGVLIWSPQQRPNWDVFSILATKFYLATAERYEYFLRTYHGTPTQTVVVHAKPTNDSAGVVMFDFDAKTNLLRGITYSGGNAETVYSDYRNVGGILLSFHVDYYVGGGPPTSTIVFDSIVLNPHQDSALYKPTASESPTVAYSIVDSPNPVAGLAVFGNRQNRILVSETGVPPSAPMSEGRIYVAADANIETGLAIANINDRPANVTFYLTDSAGQRQGQGSFAVPPRAQIARFLHESPFNTPQSMSGTLTFKSDVSVSVVAIRSHINERGELLMTTLPATAPGQSGREPVIFAHFAEGDGWTTEVVLVNPHDEELSGTLRFFNSSGEMVQSIPYSVQPRTAYVHRATANGTLQAGSIIAAPTPGAAAPAGVAIFTLRSGGVTISEGGVPATQVGTAFRMFADTQTSPLASLYGGNLWIAPGTLRTGVAVANPSSAAATVEFELLDAEGTAVEPPRKMTRSIPPNGHTSVFIDELMQIFTFHGVLRISSSTPIAVVGLRARSNERREFLVTTTPVVDEACPPAPGPAIFPHTVFGGDYVTEVKLFRAAGAGPIGKIHFFSQSGAPVDPQ